MKNIQRDQIPRPRAAPSTTRGATRASTPVDPRDDAFRKAAVLCAEITGVAAFAIGRAIEHMYKAEIDEALSVLRWAVEHEALPENAARVVSRLRQVLLNHEPAQVAVRARSL